MRMLLCSLVAVALLQVMVGDAQSDLPYSHDATQAVDHSNWMAGVSGTTPISYTTLYGGDLVVTQSLPISGQLKAGIRVLDIRLGIDSSLSQLLSSIRCTTSLWVFHGPFCQNQTFATNVLATVRSFLNSNPTEAILMRVRLENGDIPTFATDVEAAMDSFPGLFYNGSDVNPTLDRIRGKVVLLRNYDGSVRGIAYSGVNFNIQDNFNLASNADLATKWGYVKTQLIAADTMTTKGQTYLNYLTASAAEQFTGFPYFYASGKSSPGTNAPALLTGYTDGCSGKGCTGGNLCLSEYFRVNCTSSGCCSVAFDGINNITRNFIRRNVTYRTGIVMMDFPGAGLIEAIIDVSLKLSSPVKVPTSRPTSKPTTQVPTSRPTSKPTTQVPTSTPTSKPTTPKAPTTTPTSKPTTPKVPTSRPTSMPTTPPTVVVHVNPGSCFSETNTVEVEGKGVVAMKDLRIGDKVKDASGNMVRVYSFGHYQPYAMAEYLQIYIRGLSRRLEVSKNHLVFANGTTLSASTLLVGDYIDVGAGKHRMVAFVDKIAVVNRKGIYAPFTTSGTIVVSGVAASSYVTLQVDSPVLVLGRYPTPFSMHWLSHVFQTPHRIVCSVLGMAVCRRWETYNQDGISQWAERPYYAIRMRLERDGGTLIAALSLLPAFMLGLLLHVIEVGWIYLLFPVAFFYYLWFSKRKPLKNTC